MNDGETYNIQMFNDIISSAKSPMLCNNYNDSLQLYHRDFPSLSVNVVLPVAPGLDASLYIVDKVSDIFVANNYYRFHRGYRFEKPGILAEVYLQQKHPHNDAVPTIIINRSIHSDFPPTKEQEICSTALLYAACEHLKK